MLRLDGGKHPHTLYSHCNERMLLIMKKEDGSSLRRTHPHITRSVKKGLVVIVASPACALSPATALIKHGEFTHQTLYTYTLNNGQTPCSCVSGVISEHYKPDIILVLATH